MTLLSLIALAASLWVANYAYPNIDLQKAFYTAAAIAIIHLLFKNLFEDIIVKRIKVSKTRYSFKKTVSILYLVVLVAVVINIWVDSTQSLLVSYGIIAAGLAVALQDLFKNFVGGIIIIVTGIYKVGDRVEINTKKGDVIDIDILYTTLMEMGEWMSGDQATGRLTIIPNGYILSGSVNNYTKDHDFLWDDISIPITYDSDWKEAVTRILSVVRRETDHVSFSAEKSLSTLEEKYYLPRRVVEPAVFITLTDNWINFNIRYMTVVRERRMTKNKLSRLILDEIEKSDKIKVASTTLDVVGFPEGGLGGSEMDAGKVP
ncbi:MAG: Transporter, small conductance mechanosensitive ion channel (MscS) family [Methanothrix harundinacea]|uniref:Transporter, small conductance mechanosensitive ion channel (MscS) family n=1 Tax=Methanothrix harundinacea TaxID=301375 RepID=A0A101FS02_9EURY|nr:MAG: Transporter, small conductance mechanosensitive ion channel (MscS) family [Methanothrix harundinacea]